MVKKRIPREKGRDRLAVWHPRRAEGTGRDASLRVCVGGAADPRVARPAGENSRRGSEGHSPQAGPGVRGAGQYAEAANVIAADAVQPASSNGAAQQAMNPDAVSWCIWKRRVDAEALHQKDPRRIASVHQIIQDIDHIVFDKTSADERPTAQESKTSWRPSAPGRSHRCLMKLRTLGSRAPISVSACGSSSASAVRRTAPILIDCLDQIVRAEPNMNEAIVTRGRAAEKAIHECLEKLTGKKNSETSRPGRVRFWLKWWEENAGKVVRGK